MKTIFIRGRSIGRYEEKGERKIGNLKRERERKRHREREKEIERTR